MTVLAVDNIDFVYYCDLTVNSLFSVTLSDFVDFAKWKIQFID